MGADTSVLSFVFYLAYAVLLALPYLWRRTTLREIDPLDPYLVISLLLFFYSLSTLVDFGARGIAEQFESVSADSVTKYAMVCVLGQAGFAVSEILFHPNRKVSALASQRDPKSTLAFLRDEQSLRLLVGPALAIVALMVPFYMERFNIFSVASYAEWALESRIARSLDPATGIREVFLIEGPVSLLLCACTVVMFDRSRLFFGRILAGSVLVLYALVSLLAGARGQLAVVGVLVVLFFHYRVRRLSLAIVLLGGLAGYFLMNGLSIARNSSNPAEMLSLIADQIEYNGFQFLGIGQGELHTSSNLLRLIGGIDTQEDTFRMGQITMSNIVSNVPRAIWPGRPPTGSELFVQVFYPGVLDEGGGYGSFIFQDPYWDFGFAGVFLSAIAVMWMMRKVHAWLIVDRGTSFSVLLYAIVYSFLVVAVVRSGIHAGVKSALIAGAPLLLIAIIVRITSNPASTQQLFERNLSREQPPFLKVSKTSK
jgi:oligosaccharide repeat unit polymerase